MQHLRTRRKCAAAAATCFESLAETAPSTRHTQRAQKSDAEGAGVLTWQSKGRVLSPKKWYCRKSKMVTNIRPQTDALLCACTPVLYSSTCSHMETCHRLHTNDTIHLTHPSHKTNTRCKGHASDAAGQATATRQSKPWSNFSPRFLCLLVGQGCNYGFHVWHETLMHRSTCRSQSACGRCESDQPLTPLHSLLNLADRHSEIQASASSLLYFWCRDSWPDCR